MHTTTWKKTMAVDVCSEISSPRISFSHDLKELDCVPIESDGSLLNPTIDFDFCINGPQETTISSADELFANGRIRPVEIKKIETIPQRPTHQPDPPTHNSKPENTQKKRLIEFLSTSFDEEDQENKPLTKPFWQFRRSSSVNCDTNRANGLLRSLFLTRSNSTGSVPNPKQSGSPKVIRKQHSLKEATINRGNSSGSSFGPYYPYNNNNNNNINSSRKPSLRKSTSRSSSYGNGVRISPVLNIHPTYFAKGTVSLFGIGSFFCSKKSSKKKRK